MKKYLKQIPIIIYPVAYIGLLFMLYASDMMRDMPEKLQLVLFFIGLAVTVVFAVWIPYAAISNIVLAAKGRYTARETANINLLIKGLHIPAYIFHFILGSLGLLASVWGAGIILFAIIVDLLTIILSGLSAVSCAVAMCKEGQLSKGMAALCAIGSFIYCIDVVIAVVYFVLSRRKKKKIITQ